MKHLIIRFLFALCPLSTTHILAQNIYQGEIDPFENQMDYPYYSYNPNYHLDSITYFNADGTQTNSELYSFDASGNLLEKKGKHSIETWTLSDKTKIHTEYNIYGNDTTAFSRETYYKNILGKDSLTIIENWETSGWSIFYVCTFTYDNNGRVLSMSRYWDAACSEPRDKYMYTYDTNGNILSCTFQDSNFGDNLINIRKEIQSWNNDNTLSLRTIYKWDTRTKQWVGTYQYEWYYFDDGSITVFVNNWESKYSFWNLYSDIFTHTDSLGRQIEFKAELIEDLSSTTLQKSTYVYGNEELPIAVHDSIFNESLNTLELSSAQEFVYDNYNNVLVEKQYNKSNTCYLRKYYYYSNHGPATELENTNFDNRELTRNEHPNKILRNNQVLIQRGSRLYDLRGQEVR